MGEDFNTVSDTHTFKYKAWVFWLNLFSLVFVCMVLGIPIAALIALPVSTPGNETSPLPVLAPVLIAFVPLVIGFGFVLLLQVFNLVVTFSSYLRFSPEGIEHKVWPYQHLRVRWSEVDRLDKILYYDALVLKSYEIIGLSISHAWPWKHFQLAPTSIPIGMYNGWPDGPLAEDLKRYAPKLFEPRATAAATQPPVHTPGEQGLNQEQRLLAALCHASVLFAGAGFFVPLAVYIAQRQKSAYLAIQALQALIYQLVGAVFNILFPFCMVGAFFVPAVAAVLSGENAIEPIMGGIILFIALVFPMILVFFILAFALYGVVGAIQSYQGKDFRYIIIGNRLSRGSRPYGP